MTYRQLLDLLDGFNPAQLDAQVELNLGNLIRHGSRWFPCPEDFVYPYPVA